MHVNVTMFTFPAPALRLLEGFNVRSTCQLVSDVERCLRGTSPHKHSLPDVGGSCVMRPLQPHTLPVPGTAANNSEVHSTNPYLVDGACHVLMCSGHTISCHRSTRRDPNQPCHVEQMVQNPLCNEAVDTYGVRSLHPAIAEVWFTSHASSDSLPSCGAQFFGRHCCRVCHCFHCTMLYVQCI